jgi:hypothetical protein
VAFDLRYAAYPDIQKEAEQWAKETAGPYLPKILLEILLLKKENIHLREQIDLLVGRVQHIEENAPFASIVPEPPVRECAAYTGRPSR